MTLGAQQVQGIDYAYTLQGWLKGVNSTLLDSANDMGRDAFAGGARQYTARDAIGFNLNYYDTADYIPVNTGVNPFPGSMAYLPADTYRPLFNGNISSMGVYNRALTTPTYEGSPLMFYNYRYDQLNRMTSMETSRKTNMALVNWASLSIWNFYKERMAYDDNGNILKVRRQAYGTNYVMRIYDPRLGRFLSVDPLQKDYPYYTPYQFAGNKPIWAIDLEGLEEVPFWTRLGQNPVGTVMNMTWDDMWGVSYDVNRNINPLGIAVTNGYSIASGKDQDNCLY